MENTTEIYLRGELKNIESLEFWYEKLYSKKINWENIEPFKYLVEFPTKDFSEIEKAVSKTTCEIIKEEAE